MEFNLKWDWKTILVIAIIAGFVLETVALGVLNNPLAQNPAAGSNQSALPPSTYVSGIVKATVQISEYEPYLTIKEKTVPSNALEALTRMKEVEQISQIQGSYVVALRKREDVGAVFRQIRAFNLTPQATAIIALPPIIEVVGEEGNETLASEGLTLRQTMDYLLPLNENLNATMSVTGQKKQLTGMGSFVLDSRSLEIVVNATLQEAGRYAQYNVPWEKRNSVDITALRQKYNGSSMEYNKRSYAQLQRNLTVQEAATMGKQPFVTQVVGNRVVVQSNFTDSQAIRDLLGPEAEFPVSVLKESRGVNLSADLPGIEPAWHYQYQATIISPSSYSWMAPETIGVTSDSGDKASPEQQALDIRVEAIGDTIVKISDAKLR